MSQFLKIAIIGAADSVGEALVSILEERDFPVAELVLLGRDDSVGQSLSFRDRQVRVKSLDGFDFSGIDLAFLAAGADVSRELAATIIAGNCSLIDLGAGLPLDQAPCVLPEAGFDRLALSGMPVQLSSPTPSAIAVALVLEALRPLLVPKKVQVTAMLCVSSIGRSGVRELARQTAELLNGRPLEPKGLDRQIAFNLLAQVGAADEQGHSHLERRLVEELRQLTGISDLPVAATCTLAPVFFGDSLVVNVQADTSIDVPAVSALLAQAPGIELVEAGDYPTVVGDAMDQDVIHVGRVRGVAGDPTQLNLWIASDNVRKGAALNAVQIAELLIKHYL